MVKTAKRLALEQRENQETNFVAHCACVIHGDAYPWIYVERLYNMLTRNLSWPVKLHVWTEAHRSVPEHMIKHALIPWDNVNGPKRAWWYKMQMFDSTHHQGNLLYFDLDTVIVRNLDWIMSLNNRWFWAIRDWKYLWKSHWQGINSSIMFWDTRQFDWLWRQFESQPLPTTLRLFPGDQDFLSHHIDQKDRRFFPDGAMQSWRWQVQDGGMNMLSRKYLRPGAGAVVDESLQVMVFHGRPKPHEINDGVIASLWC